MLLDWIGLDLLPDPIHPIILEGQSKNPMDIQYRIRKLYVDLHFYGHASDIRPLANTKFDYRKHSND